MTSAHRRGGRPLLPAADSAFAQALRGGREALGLTLMETAARAGISHAYISELERGLRRPSEQTIGRLGFVLEDRQKTRPTDDRPGGLLSQLG